MTLSTKVYADLEALSEEAAEIAFTRIRRAMDARGRAAIVLSGGSTPRECYGLLAEKIVRAAVPVDRMLWIFGDERWVPVPHPDSNEGMARRTLLTRIRAPEDTILSWNAGSGDPVECARRYAEGIRARLAGDGIDLLLLGMGPDGHTASLFPDAAAVFPDGRRVTVAADMPADCAAVRLKEGNWRLTLCPVFLNKAALALFLVSGAEKRESLRRALRADPAVPASWVRPAETVFLTTRETMGDGPPDYPAGVRFA